MASAGGDFLFVTAGAPDGPDCAARVLDELANELGRSGSGLADLLKLRIFYARQDQYGPFSAERGQRFRAAFADGEFPATTGVVTGALPDGHGIEIEAIATRERRAANSPRVYSTFPNATTPPAFAHLAEGRGLMVLSGQTGFDVNGATIAEGAREQAAASLENLRYVLEDSGNRRAELLKLTIYITDDHFRSEVLDEVSRFVGGLEQSRPPSVTLLVVGALFKPDVLVEIEAVAEPVAGTARCVFATGASNEGTKAAPDALEQALSNLDRELESARLSLGDVRLCTAWLAAPHMSAELTERLVARLAVSGVKPVVAPMQHHDGAGGIAVVEAVALRGED